MKFRHELRYDASPGEVYAMLADPAFREQVCEAQHAHDWDVTIEGEDSSMTVAVDQKRPADRLPGFAKKFVGDEIHIAQREDWTGPSSARLEVLIPRKPGHLKGTVELAENGGGTVETVSGDLRVNVPMVAGKLETMIAQMLELALQTEERVGRDWLARER